MSSPLVSAMPPTHEEDPPYLRNDPGLACLTSQLGRINAQLRFLDNLKKRVAEAEEHCKRDLAASRAKSLASSSSSNDNGKSHSSQTKPAGQDAWERKWDSEVEAEYWFNSVTGEASWLDPRGYGKIAG